MRYSSRQSHYVEGFKKRWAVLLSILIRMLITSPNASIAFTISVPTLRGFDKLSLSPKFESQAKGDPRACEWGKFDVMMGLGGVGSCEKERQCTSHFVPWHAAVLSGGTMLTWTHFSSRGFMLIGVFLDP